MSKIFISYSSSDVDFARRLATSLSKLGIDIWIAIKDIPAGMKWSTAIQQGLNVCEAMIVIVTPDSMASGNVEDEWQYFLDEKKIVIPVLLLPAQFHFQLRRIQYIDFHTQNYENALDQLRRDLARRGVVLDLHAGDERVTEAASNSFKDFFESKDKHPWSRIKDRILGSYMPPYIAKVVKRGQPLLLIDAFAGPGKTAKGEPGSPLIICKAAEKAAPGKYRAIFVNNDERYHNQLSEILQAAGWSAAKPILGDGPTFLQAVRPLLTTRSVFLYIDPFGLNCEFDVLEPFLKRDKAYSTEILINLHAPILHRLAARDAYLRGTGKRDQIENWHDKLTRALGGDYWKDAMLSPTVMDAKTREQMVIEGYKKRLSSTGYLTYTGSCPVQASRDGATKYYMVFASPHADAMLLLNDEMCKAFNGYMHEAEIRDTLFAGQHWTDWRDLTKLKNLVVEYTTKFPGKTRKELWFFIVRDHFMLFTHSEYIKAVADAVETKRIECSTPYPSNARPTKRLNDNCVLMPVR